ncbi:hypothetical protein BU23DRAFT_601934 [Bimuria novae-zelandiae CBS 107.79]|uniref:Uncharacterized protein n=1 Tax=Bimuria novae-zelandiae CBS 107.79 TaxID=1447943 RepID=A0A6A5UWY1_9PLEO|nr:hypothetical protein BU23DRAFT_601934 [Bimuria novae-zelandiae CBS 107.79]
MLVAMRMCWTAPVTRLSWKFSLVACPRILPTFANMHYHSTLYPVPGANTLSIKETDQMQYDVPWLMRAPWLLTIGHGPNSYTVTVTFLGYHEKCRIWRFARLTIQPDLKINIISQRFVVEVLEVEIERTTAHSAGHSRRWGDLVTIGYVDLEWNLHQSINALRGLTRFEVTQDFDPPFDALLGYGESFRRDLLWKNR